MSDSREREVTRALVRLAGSLVRGYDIAELLSELTADCAQLLDIASAGLLLADERGVLHVVAASSERTRQLELFQVQRAEGPCRDCYLTGAPVSAPDLPTKAGRWPHFVPAALGAGFASVHALPMRLRDQVLGALGLFGTASGSLDPDDLSLGQALADIASVTIVQHRERSDQRSVNEQLQAALQSRIVLEQAKGVLAQQGSLEMDEAFRALRRYARDHNVRLTAVAEAVVTRRLPAQQLLARSPEPASAEPCGTPGVHRSVDGGQRIGGTGQRHSAAGSSHDDDAFSIAMGVWVDRGIEQSQQRAELIRELDRTRAELAEPHPHKEWPPGTEGVAERRVLMEEVARESLAEARAIGEATVRTSCCGSSPSSGWTTGLGRSWWPSSGGCCPAPGGSGSRTSAELGSAERGGQGDRVLGDRRALQAEGSGPDRVALGARHGLVADHEGGLAVLDALVGQLRAEDLDLTGVGAQGHRAGGTGAVHLPVGGLRGRLSSRGGRLGFLTGARENRGTGVLLGARARCERDQEEPADEDDR